MKTYKPSSPGRRGMTGFDFKELTPDKKPEKALLEPSHSTGGRNNYGRITSRFRGGGHKQRYRVIDIGPYSGLIVDEVGGLAVKGELWSVSARCLSVLDEFEGAGDSFIRAAVAISSQENVDAYFWNRPLPANARSVDRLPLSVTL